jgi:hypothetical protein
MQAVRVLVAVVAAGLACVEAAGAQGTAPQAAESAGFVLMRGRDTVALERFERFDVSWKGTLVLPREREIAQQWSAVTGPDGSVPLVEVTVTEKPPEPRMKPRIVTRTRLIVRDDSVAVDQMTSHGLVTRVMATERGARPYLNLSFALIELAVQTTPKVPEATIPFFNVDGGQTATGTLRRNPDGSALLSLGSTEIALVLDDDRIRSAAIASQGLRIERTK